MKKSRIILMLAVGLAFGCGCARSDWIDQTLVTVDVTGRWSGSCAGVGVGSSVPIIEMTLEQGGPKVTGQARTQPGSSRRIEGTVNGDVFRYASQAGDNMAGELQVSGDEMNGWVLTSVRSSCQLRRQSSESPRSQ